MGGMQSSAIARAIKFPRIVAASGVSNMRSGKLLKSKSKPVNVKVQLYNRPNESVFQMCDVYP